MSDEALWITERDVVDLMSLGEAIGALERGLRLEAEGGARNMAKTHVKWGGQNTLHAIGAVVDGAGVVGTKTWAHTTGGACPVLMLFDSETGALRAVIEAFALGQMRTGSMSGVATKWMAAEGADELAIIGTGKQAITQVAAVQAVRPLKRVRVYSPRAESRAAFGETLKRHFDADIVLSESVAAAVSGAAVVTLVTRATEPFLTAGMLARGSHVNAVGAITPERVEFDQTVFGRAGWVAVDTLDSVRRLSREFIDYYGQDRADWSEVKPISELVAAGRGRPPDVDVSLFKAMGMGISDLALGVEVLVRARSAGKGRPVPQPRKVQPRLV